MKATWQRLLKGSMRLAKRSSRRSAIALAAAAVKAAIQDLGTDHPQVKRAETYLVLLRWSLDDFRYAVAFLRSQS